MSWTQYFLTTRGNGIYKAYASHHGMEAKVKVTPLYKSRRHQHFPTESIAYMGTLGFGQHICSSMAQKTGSELMSHIVHILGTGK